MVAMGFADASVCLNCGNRIEQANRCTHCGLDLATHEIQQAWQALVVADQWVERAKTVQGFGATAAPQAMASTPAEQAPQHPPTAEQPPKHPPTAEQPKPRRSISTGSVLLGLGALFILVAGSIFISVTWGSLGLLGRALVLLGVTVLIGGLGSFVTRRGLRASAEAVWSVFFGLLTLDWFAARDQGLAGLDTWPFGVSATVWAVVVIAAALLVVPRGRQSLGKELLAPSIVAGVAAWFAAGSLAAELSDETSGDTEFWPAVLAVVVAAVAGLVLRRASVRVGSWISFAGAAFFGLFAVGFAIAEAVDHPSLTDLVLDAHGLPLLLVVVATIGVGVLDERARLAASAAALAGVATLILLPVNEAWPERGAFVVGAGLLAAAAWLFTGAGRWFQGARVTVVLGGSVLALATTPWLGRLLVVVAEGASASRTDALMTPLVPDLAPATGPWWVVALVTVGLSAVILGARRWPETDDVRAHLPAVATCFAVVGAWAVLATFDPAAVVLGGSLVAGGALLALVLPGSMWWRWVGPAVVALAPLATLSSWPAAVIIWPVAGMLLAVIAARTHDVALRCAAAFAAAGWGLGTVVPALELIDGDDRWTALALVVAALVGLAVSLFAVRDDLAHLGVEVSSASLGAVGLALGSSVSTLEFASFMWTVAGTGVVILGLVSTRRTWYLWVGSAVVALAPLWTLSSWPAAVIIWPAAGLVLAVVAVRARDVVLRCAAAFAATGWGLGTVLPALELLDGDDRWTALALVVAGLVGLAASLFAVRDDLTHVAVEAASAALGVGGIALGTSVSTLGYASFVWTVAGVGVVVLGLTSSRRTWYRWVGSGLLGVAYVLRLAASEVDVVEAYTLPFAAFLLAVGLWAMRDENGPGSVQALLPGVALALLPSLPQALDEPTGVRALLLGVGAAVALGIGIWRRWQVPFVAGAIILVLLTVANLGPVALAVPRWTLLAVAGVVFGGAGITWEARVRDGRAAIRYVGSMR